MTSKKVQWDKLDQMIEKSQTTVSDFKRLDEIKKEKKGLEEQQSKLSEEEFNIREKYKQEYTNKLNDRLDEFGILTIVTASDYDEGRIISVTEDEMKVRYSYNYGSSSTEFTISTQELREKGFVKAELYGGTVYIVDEIKDPLDVFEIIKYRLKCEMGSHINSLKWAREDIVKSTAREKTELEELEKYKKVSDAMITREFNNISFGVTNLKINDVLKALPREICLYKGEKDESND